jgi:hypothetical protein
LAHTHSSCPATFAAFAAQAEVFWLQGKRVSVVRDQHGLLLEQLDKHGSWPWQQQRHQDIDENASTTLRYGEQLGRGSL